MIHEFERIGIEARAIEQPLDLNVPESKIMLAIYLASPEVEDDRRSMNVFNGMRKAKKERRCMGTAPLGYIEIHAMQNISLLLSPMRTRHLFDLHLMNSPLETSHRKKLDSG